MNNSLSQIFKWLTGQHDVPMLHALLHDFNRAEINRSSLVVENNQIKCGLVSIIVPIIVNQKDLASA